MGLWAWIFGGAEKVVRAVKGKRKYTKGAAWRKAALARRQEEWVKAISARMAVNRNNTWLRRNVESGKIRYSRGLYALADVLATSAKSSRTPFPKRKLVKTVESLPEVKLALPMTQPSQVTCCQEEQVAAAQ